jgi:catechol 2,3-dioxygenase-like lactoylglutathione lyase family enzyme
MRLDHIAYRVKDRKKTARFFIDALGYRIQTEFNLEFSDGTTTECIALEPPEKSNHSLWKIEGFSLVFPPSDNSLNIQQGAKIPEYHCPPEIFVSDGPPESIVGKWVAARSNIGGIHHLAYQVESVESTMKEWQEKGYAEFATDKPLTCPGLTQVFTKPSELTGVIYEFIERGEHGFCKENVKALMESTKENK